MSRYILIKCGKLYDGLENCLHENMEVLVEDNLIKEVGKSVTKPNNTEIIDLSDVTVTPGLSDAHVHYSIGNWHNRNYETIYENPVYKGMTVLFNAKKSLMRGFTTVRHCGSNCDDAYGSIVAKRMINEGYFVGSRLVVAPHYLSTTRGHGDSSQLIKTNPKLATFIWENYPGYGCGADSFRDVVRKQVKFGADFIKIFASGGFNSTGDGPEDNAFSDEELNAIIGTAHALGRKVSSHSYPPAVIWRQLEMGIDGIEHGALIDDPKLLNAMKEKNIDFVPTFCPYDGAINADEETINKHTLGMARKLRYYRDWLIEARKMIVKSEIEIGYGTDFVAAHNPYDCGYEYKSMLNSGVDPYRALAAATRVNAKILNMSNEIGAVAPGYYADIAAWKRDILNDPRALLDCYFVMKDGIVYKTEATE